MSQYPAVIQLTDLDGSNGFVIKGVPTGGQTGASVASAGDVNGDGIPDLIVGDPKADTFALSPGAAFVVFGTDRHFDATFNLSTLDGHNGFRISGIQSEDYAGRQVSSAGDLNGDGFDDVVVSSGFHNPGNYVIYGKAGGFSSNMSLSEIDGTNGFRIDDNGLVATKAGDVNGDGVSDLVIGDGGASVTYVLFGNPDGFGSEIALTALDGADGFKIVGPTQHEQSGQDVASAGDVNGDGLADLVIGAPFAEPHGTNSGTVYVVFGTAAGAPSIDLTDLDGSNGFKLVGSFSPASLGDTVASADVNGDGFTDLIVGAEWESANGTVSGAAYVIYGKASGFSASLETSAIDGTNGFKMVGGLYDHAGSSVASAGDVNGDGFDDIIVSVPGPNAGTDPGAVYVVFGAASGIPANLVLSTLDGTDGFKLAGEYQQGVGHVSSAGDLNGDGLADLMVGSPGYGSTGGVYVVYGRLPVGPVDRVGTEIGQSLVGGNSKDRLSGLGGDDHLWGHGSKDKLSGGDGNDVIDAGSGNDKLDGGDGDDALIGGVGRDHLSGGLGRDVLTGGTAGDTFAFSSLAETAKTAPDLITDFGAGDQIDLKKIDADILTSGNQAFHLGGGGGHAGDIVVTYDAGHDRTTVDLYVDNNATVDARIYLTGDHSGLAAADFVL